jgi:hypothetical protein
MASSGGVDIRIVESRQFAEMAAKLKGADRQLRLGLNKAIRTAAVPVVVHLKTEVMSITSKVDGKSGSSSGETARAQHAGSRKIQAGRSHGLRATIARAIQVKVTSVGPRASVRIRVDASQLPADEKTLPRALDSAKGWRHPVFGHDAWVHQTGKPWWHRTILEHEAQFREAITKAMREVVAKL